MLGLVRSAPAAGPYDDLLKRTPANTNSLVLIDVKGAMNSPLARAEKWREQATASGRGGLGFVPPDAEPVVIAGEVNLTTLVRDFQVGLVKVRNTPTMRELAMREGGTADEIAGRLSVLSPRDVYFTTLSAQELAAIYPADRQYTARYIKTALAAKSVAALPLPPEGGRERGRQHAHHRARSRRCRGPDHRQAVAAVEPVGGENQGGGCQPPSALLASVKGLTVAVKVTEHHQRQRHGRIPQRSIGLQEDASRSFPRTDRGAGDRHRGLRVVASHVHRNHDDADRHAEFARSETACLALRVPTTRGRGRPDDEG